MVADWSAGTDLVDLIAEHPLPPATAARLLEPLAAAVERAHVAGLVLGVDHPQRIRVTPDGTLRLAFPGALPDASPRDDVKGLGAILYLLLTGRWPLPGGPARDPARRRSGRTARSWPPETLTPVPHELSALALRSLEDTSIGGIRNSATLLSVLDQAAGSAEQTEHLRPVVPGGEDDDGPVWTTRPPVERQTKRRKLAIGVTALAVATVGVLAWVGMLLIDFFGDDTGSSGTPVTITQPPPEQGESAPPKPQSAGPIDPAGVSGVQPRGHRGRRAERQQRRPTATRGRSGRPTTTSSSSPRSSPASGSWRRSTTRSASPR